MCSSLVVTAAVLLALVPVWSPPNALATAVNGLRRADGNTYGALHDLGDSSIMQSARTAHRRVDEGQSIASRNTTVCFINEMNIASSQVVSMLSAVCAAAVSTQSCSHCYSRCTCQHANHLSLRAC